MDPFSRPEQQSDENESHKKPTWPWEKVPEDKETKKKLDDQDEKEAKKKAEQSKKEKEAKKEDKLEKQAQEPDEEKRERRTTLVEQSIALVAKYEEEPIPRDANTLARLMIAHQVIHLNNQLEQPDSERPLVPEEIEATLDYITQLDAKFKNPAIKAEPAIEQSYQEIMEVAEATLEEESDLGRVIDEIGKSPNSYEATSGGSLDPLSARRGEQKNEDEFDRRKEATKETVPAVATAITLVYLITHLGRKKPKKEPEQTTINGSGSDYSPSYPDQSPSANPRPYAQQNYTPNEQLPGPIDQSLYTSPLWSEHTPTIPGREHVAIPDRRPSPAFATAAVATALAATLSRSETPRTIAASPETNHSSGESAKPEFSTPSQRQATTPENPSADSQRKIEHLPLLQLLTMAENIDIGHGRYLRREFEAGHIDREGLVKILKAHSKGRDYQFEFRQQAGRFAKLKETSPEFLHQTKSAKTDEANNEPLEEKRLVSPDTTPQIDKKTTPFSLAPPTKYNLLPGFTSGIHQPKHTGRRLAIITIAALAGLVLVGWLAVTIFNALS